MLALDFTGAFSSQITIGPADFLRIEGPTIFSGTAHEPIAHLNGNNQWEVGDRYFTRYEINDSLHVRLIDGTDETRTGPFNRFSSAGPVKYANDRPFARFDHVARRWQDIASNRLWRVLLLHPADGAWR